MKYEFHDIALLLVALTLIGVITLKINGYITTTLSLIIGYFLREARN